MSTALEQLNELGRFPPISLQIEPLDAGRKSVVIKQFLSYSFSSSVIVPVSAFSFEMKLSGDQRPNEIVRSGDIATLLAGDDNIPLCTGIVDTRDMETDGVSGERIYVIGRDLMAQLEDNEAISLNSDKFWSTGDIESVVSRLCKNTRIRSGLDNRGVPTGATLFSTEPGESRLTSLQRFLEPLNCLTWMSAVGKMIVGKPNMKQQPKSLFYINRKERKANVLAIKSTRSEALVANAVLPVWTGMESIQSGLSPEQAVINSAEGPSRLYKAGHYVIRSVVVSAPSVNSSGTSKAELNRFLAGGSNPLQAYAKRMIARENLNELIVQVVAPGHFDDAGDPFVVDTTHRVVYDRDDIDDVLYCFGVEYGLNDATGPTTKLLLCKLGAIVADSEAP